MYPFLTDEANNALQTAEHEARMLNHEEIDTAHILLGLYAEEESIAGITLRSFDVSASKMRSRITSHGYRNQFGQGRPAGPLPFSSDAKQVLDILKPNNEFYDYSVANTGHVLRVVLFKNGGWSQDRIPLLDYASSEAVYRRINTVHLALSQDELEFHRFDENTQQLLRRALLRAVERGNDRVSIPELFLALSELGYQEALQV